MTKWMVIVVWLGIGVAIAAQGPGAAPREERKVLAQFDADRNGRLDAAERTAARAWLAEHPLAGPFGALRRMGQGGGMGRRFAPATPGPRVVPDGVRSGGSAPLYDLGTLRTVFIQFEQADWQPELDAFWNTDVEVPATVTVDGIAYRDVGVHYRGASSFMMVPAGSKRSLNLSFDFVQPSQRLRGVRTLNLLNVNGDATYVRPVLYGDIGRQYVPMPKANYMKVVINGEYWGVYVNVQQFNGDFTREAFGQDAGTRWKVPGSPWGRAGLEYLGDEVSAYRTLYQIKSKDDPAAWAAFIRLCKTLKETPVERLERALAPMLDIDGVLRFLAVEMALVNTDGYWVRASDYAIYLDPSGRFHIVPHDMNEAMMEEGGGRPPGPPRAGGPAVPPGPPPGLPPGGMPPIPMGAMAAARPTLDPLYGLDDPAKPLRSRLLAVPALKTKYLRYVREIADKHMAWSVVEPKARRWQALLADAVKADTKKLYAFDRFERDLAEGEHSLKAFLEARRAYLLEAIPK